MRFLLANAFLFLAISGVLYYQYFFQSPNSSVTIAMASQLRNPAAASGNLPAVIEPKPLKEKQPIDLDWKVSLACKNTEKELTQKYDAVILSIRKCEKDFPKEMVIENQTNGFTASVFALSGSHAKTDSIPLKKGKNVVIIKYILSKSKAEIVEKLSIQH